MAYKLQQNVKREKCARIAPLFSPPPSLSSPIHSPFSLFILPLCRVSATTPLFCQINISQNKSQDNFKLAGEEKRDGVRRGGRLGSVRAPPVKWSLRLLPHLILRSAVLSFASAPSDEVVTTHECQRRGDMGQTCMHDAHLHICVASKKKKILVDLIRSSATVLIRFTRGLRVPSFRV